MSNKIIRAALESRLSQWAASQPLPVSYENVAFTKPDDTPYVECRLIPNVTTNREVSAAKQRRTGLFQVNVWTPQGIGMGQAETLAEAVVALFPVVPKSLGNLSIEQTPTIRPAILDGASWVIVPVLIKYRYES